MDCSVGSGSGFGSGSYNSWHITSPATHTPPILVKVSTLFFFQLPNKRDVPNPEEPITIGSFSCFGFRVFSMIKESVRWDGIEYLQPSNIWNNRCAMSWSWQTIEGDVRGRIICQGTLIWKRDTIMIVDRLIWEPGTSSNVDLKKKYVTLKRH